MRVAFSLIALLLALAAPAHAVLVVGVNSRQLTPAQTDPCNTSTVLPTGELGNMSTATWDTISDTTDVTCSFEFNYPTDNPATVNVRVHWLSDGTTDNVCWAAACGCHEVGVTDASTDVRGTTEAVSVAVSGDEYTALEDDITGVTCADAAADRVCQVYLQRLFDEAGCADDAGPVQTYRTEMRSNE